MASGDPKDITRFSEWAKWYEKSELQWLFFDRVQRTVLDTVDRGTRPESILDVGCGTGRLLRKARERWPAARLSGVDPAEGMIEQARMLMPEATFFLGAAESLPFPDASFDLAFSTLSFHHWADQQQGLRETGRVLRPGGRFILGDIIMPGVLSKLVHHFHPNDPAKIREMFTSAGLDVQMQKRVMGRFVLVTVGVRG
jgi:ubiquinone/menaquinone biosynthesis C-methylase UbiE